MPPLIGIDLGTTNSLAAVFGGGSARIVPNSLGRRLTPSVVGVLPDRRVVVGEAAADLSVTRPARTAAWFKRAMGTDQEFELGGRSLAPQELSSLVLRALKEDLEADLGEEVSQAVITVPAYFNDNQRQATRLAGELAGLKVQRMVNEPTAAALAYGLHDHQGDRKVLVFDLGGGTFDVTLMEIFEGTFEIVATAGENHLGGEDFTDRVVDWALRQHGLVFESVEVAEPLRMARLRRECERAKLQVQGGVIAEIAMPAADGTLTPDCKVLRIDEPQFAKLTGSLGERLVRPLRRALRDGRTEPGEVDQILLVGGATRMRSVREMVRSFFGKEPVTDVDPDEAVALGAAVQAALIADDRSVGDIVMTDVCPFTLGVQITKEFGSERRDGYFLPVIHRNTTLPVSCQETVATMDPHQTEIRVEVYQGESRRVEGNLLLGQLTVSGIPPGPAGQAVHLRFTYDLNGILEVEAVVDETGARFHSVFAHNVANLSQAEIDKAVARMQRVKFYPRDDLGNRGLLLFAERVVGQVSPHERGTLEAFVDAYERQLLQGGDREAFDMARQSLLELLSRLGHPHEG